MLRSVLFPRRSLLAVTVLMAALLGLACANEAVDLRGATADPSSAEPAEAVAATEANELAAAAEAAGTIEPEVASETGAEAGADGPPLDAAQQRAADEAALEALVVEFVQALIAGDGEALWSLLTLEFQARISREQAQATASTVRAAYAEPGFVFRGFLRLTIEGDLAEFIADAYITDGGVRQGSAAQAAASPPLFALRQEGRWRLIPDVTLFLLGEAELTVE